MNSTIRRRRGGPLVHVAVDLVRAARFYRRLSLVPLVVLIGTVALIAFVGFTAAPWVIYPGL